VKLDHAAAIADYKSGLSFTQVARKHGADVSLTRKVIIKSGVALHPKNSGRLRGENHPQWRGGRWRLSDGYLGSADGREHRLEMEAVIGRTLAVWEDVHHVDGVKTNNDRQNLVVMPEREHQRFHTFLLHRALPISRETLDKFCRREGDHVYRFTVRDHDAAAETTPLTDGSFLRKKSVRKCRVPGCGKKHSGKGYCSMHYQRWRAVRKGGWVSGGGRRAKYKKGTIK